jgi:hypothetical protein
MTDLRPQSTLSDLWGGCRNGCYLANLTTQSFRSAGVQPGIFLMLPFVVLIRTAQVPPYSVPRS